MHYKHPQRAAIGWSCHQLCPSCPASPSHSALAPCLPLPVAAVAHSHRPCEWLFICLVSVNHPRGSNSSNIGSSGNGGCLACSIWGVACCMCLIEKSYATRIIMFIAIIWCKFAELKLNALDVGDAPVAWPPAPAPAPAPARQWQQPGNPDVLTPPSTHTHTQLNLLAVIVVFGCWCTLNCTWNCTFQRLLIMTDNYVIECCHTRPPCQCSPSHSAQV